MKPTTAQVAVIGAMQRAHPALTQLWLRWTGIPDLADAEFRVSRSEHEDAAPETSVMLPPRAGIQVGWNQLCDVMALPSDAEERRTMPIRIRSNSMAHQSFWESMKKRELTEVDGPLEWWWRLMILRNRSIKRASKKLLSAVFGEDPIFEGAILSIVNPSILKEGRRSTDIVPGQYKRPTDIIVSKSVDAKSKYEGLSFSLSDDKLLGHFTTHLLHLATTRMS